LIAFSGMARRAATKDAAAPKANTTTEEVNPQAKTTQSTKKPA